MCVCVVVLCLACLLICFVCIFCRMCSMCFGVLLFLSVVCLSVLRVWFSFCCFLPLLYVCVLWCVYVFVCFVVDYVCVILVAACRCVRLMFVFNMCAVYMPVRRVICLIVMCWPRMCVLCVVCVRVFVLII